MLNIKELRKAKNITQDQIVELTGINKRSYVDYENGKRDIPFSKLQKIAAALKVSLHELINYSEKNNKRLQNDTGLSLDVNPNGTNGNVSVPFISKYNINEYITQINQRDFINSLPLIYWKRNQDYAGVAYEKFMTFEMAGDSMEDGTYKSFLDGDFLLGVEIDKEQWTVSKLWEKWNYVIIHDDITVTKILKSDNENSFHCHPLNQDFYADFTIEKSNVKKIFRITQMYRKARF